MIRLAALGLVLTSTIAACDRCLGTLSCEQAPRIAVLGQILERSGGTAVAGAAIELRRVSGVALANDVVTTVTNSEGAFRFEELAEGIGDVVVTINVASPGEQPYQVISVPTRATVATGEATILPPWVSSQPVFLYVIEMYLNGTEDQRATTAEVEFRRASGVRMFRNGVEVNTVTATANEQGWAFLFTDVTSDAAGSMVGDLIVRLPSWSDSTVIRGVDFPSREIFSPQLLLARIGVGPE